MVITPNCELEMSRKSKNTTRICPPRWYPLVNYGVPAQGLFSYQVYR